MEEKRMTTERINAVVEYIEAHLEEELTMQELSRIAGYSTYDFQRMFIYLSGISVAEYIRNRRMTLAGQDLKSGRETVLSVALKYGYQSPVSFCRAFKKFHGINPGTVEKTDAVLRVFNRILFKIVCQEIAQPIRKEQRCVKGKMYEAEYFGEADMSAWSEVYAARAFYRLLDAYEDLKDCLLANTVLPYNNYPPIQIEEGQAFLVVYRKKNGEIEEKYYLSNGKVWKNLPCTQEILLASSKPLRIERIAIAGKEYECEYFGEVDISKWSQPYQKRAFRRIRGAFEDLKRHGEATGDVLPYDNYPAIEIHAGDAFAVDYYKKENGEMERHYHLATGIVWQNMVCTQRFMLEE